MTAEVIVVIVWFMYFVLRGSWHVFPTGGFYSFLFHFAFLFSIVAPLGIVRFFEKQSVVDRFGLQPLRFVGLCFLVSVTLAVCYLSDILLFDAFLAVVLAPISEEWLFRGYMLGRFRNEKFLSSQVTLASLKGFFCPLLLVSVAFALSHVFIYGLGAELVAVLGGGLVFGSVYLITGSILSSMTVHALANFLAKVKPEYQFSLYYWMWLFLLLLPAVFLVPVKYGRKSMNEGGGAKKPGEEEFEDFVGL